MTTSRTRKFSRYEDATEFRSNKIKLGYKTSLVKDWQGLYLVSYK